MGELHASALTEQISSIGPGCCLSKLWSDSRSSRTGVSRMSGMVSKESVSRKRLRLVFLRAPEPPVTLIRDGSDCLSVLDRDPHVVEVCGAFSVLHSHNPHTPNTHTIHVAADSAGCRPSGPWAGPSASQSANCLPSVHSKTNPTTLACSADRLSPSSWIHIVHCCLPSPSSAMVCLLSPRSIFLESTPTSNAHADGNGSTDPSNSVLASQQQSSFMLRSSVSWCDCSMWRNCPCC